jgi:hypothetical protein
MKILFIARHYSYLRMFESAIAELASRGHTITLAADREEALGGRGMVERLAGRFPNVRLATAPGRHTGAWAEIARWVRLGLDYLRFLQPAYDSTPHLRARSRERAPRVAVRLAETIGASPVRALLGVLERGLPMAPGIEGFLRAEAPDLLLITPLVDIGSPQLDHFTAARRLGLRIVLPVGSWDHLSSKSLLRQVPDRIIVWNEIQRREAETMHGAPAGRVVVTGSQCYDQWFDRCPSRTREEFCRRVGLPADRPFLLYACSSLFRGTADEPAFVEAWIRAIRGSDDPAIRDIGILVRPHPARLDEWQTVDLTGYRDVAFWGAHPVDDEAKDDYFDSMYYCAGVVGLNTSAFIEAAAVGKPVHAVVLPEISESNQEGTLHFRYLVDVNGGLLYVTRSLDEHVRSLPALLAGDGGGDPRAARFVDGFVRPFGRHEPATPRFAAAIEEAATLPAPRPERRTAGALAGYAALYPAAAAIALHLRSQPWRKKTKHKWRKAYQRQRAEFFRRIKAFVVERMSSAKPPKAAVAHAGPSTLTPKVGVARHASKTLPGMHLPEARETRELVTVLGRSGKPIILGPWLSETGFELLYWIPFLAWARTYGNFDPERLLVVSRGGAAPWYRHITPHYHDIFSFYSPEEFRQANDARIAEQEGKLKHLEMTRFDREILDRVQRERGLRGAEVLHPSQMYRLFENFWYQRAPMTLVEGFTQFAMIGDGLPAAAGSGATEAGSSATAAGDRDPASDVASLIARVMASLPREYVAAKFYGNAALPDTPENRAFAVSFLTELAEQTDVVLLNTNQRFDDHSDFPSALRGRLHTIDHLMPPVHNLAIQTQVIRGARAFVGTYGGFSYLAPLCGVNTLAFYSHPGGFRFDHLEVAKRVFSGLRAGTFVELDVRGLDVLRLGFGHAVASLGSR